MYLVSSTDYDVPSTEYGAVVPDQRGAVCLLSVLNIRNLTVARQPPLPVRSPMQISNIQISNIRNEGWTHQKLLLLYVVVGVLHDLLRCDLAVLTNLP